jgi:putative transposase
MLVTPEKAESASLMMKNLGQRFVQFVNRTHQRSGSLWEGRFRSSIVDSEAYLLACYRYIELNPVRAGMVTHAADYAWSSYRTNALGDASDLVVAHERYLALAPNAAVRQAAYRALFGHAIGDDELKSIREAVNGGFALGSKAFLARLASTAGRRTSPGVRGRPPKENRGQTTFSRLEEKCGLSPI